MYGKVFAQIFDGTLHGRLEATAVFMAMIAIADQDGVVNLTLTALTSRTGWPAKFVERGIRELEKEDVASRTPDEEGRRITRLRDNTDWGWRITNYQKYRAIRDEGGRREYMREYMRKRRGKHSLTPVNTSKPQLAHTEAEDKNLFEDADASTQAGTLKTEIYRLAKSLKIAGGLITQEVNRYGEDAVWAALTATVKARPADALPYFRGVLKPKERGFVC